MRAQRLIEARDATLLPGLVDAYFFIPKGQRAETLSALVALSGERPGDRYHDWVELVGRRENLVAKPGYLPFKAGLLARIDPRYRLPGHQAFWFGWYSFFPGAELYGALPR